MAELKDRPIYLDYHATTPVDPRVMERMFPFFSKAYGNPSSENHFFGKEAKKAVENSREEVAGVLGCDPQEVIFTSGATESNNIALKGIVRAKASETKHVISCVTEHKAVLNPLKDLEENGVKITWLSVDQKGQIDLQELKDAITDETVLISLMYGNNEIGTLYPVDKIGALAKEKGVLFHCDAAQAVGKVPMDVEEMGIDLLSLSAHKFYGPKGIGALYIRKRKPRVKLSPILHGSVQERGLRPGTLNVPAIVGLGAAARIAQDELLEEASRLARLRDQLQKSIEKSVDGIRINGDQANRLPNNLSVSFQGVVGETFLEHFTDVAVSSGSACTTTSIEPSHVLRAIGLEDELALSTIRYGLGRFTTQQEVEQAFEATRAIVERLRKG